MKTEGTTQTHISPPFKGMGGIIHIAAWGILFGLPFFFTGRESQVLTVTSYLRSVIVPLSFMMVFYVNYFLLVNRYLFSRHGWKFFLSNVALIAAAIILVHLLMQLLPPPEIPHPHRSERELKDVIGFFTVNAMLYALVAGLSVAIKMTSGWYQIESMRRELEKSRAEAELQNLKSQLNPHFLFNTLNNIYSLIAINQDKAQYAVHDLSRMLRHVLYENNQHFVSVDKEFEFMKSYIELMSLRLPKSTRLEVSIPERGNRAMIAPLLFIPLIENAFKHGVSSTQESFINIKLELQENNRLNCLVENSNYPKKDNDRSGSGIGLTNLKRRLELLYPGKYIFKAENLNNRFITELLIQL